jgi:nucleotide-binding universal stress UspA family protein
MDVLIYIDDLPTSNDTLALAALWLAHMPARITLMTVHDLALQDSAIARLSAAVHSPIMFKVERGDPVDALCAECEAGAYDLLIAAPAGRSRLERLVRGSRIGHMVHSINTSVLIARQAPPVIRRILVGVGTAEHALVDVRVAMRIARAFQAEVTVLHVMSQVPLMFTGLDHVRLELDAYLKSGLPGTPILAAARQIMADAGLKPAIHLREGLVRDEIMHQVAEGDYDLVVIGAHTGEGWMSLLLDDIANHIVRDCPISTLVVWGEPRWGVMQAA